MFARLFRARYVIASALVVWLTACATAATPTPVVLNLAATDLAAPLLADLATAYAQTHAEVVILRDTIPLATLTRDLTSGQTALGLVATRPANFFATPLGTITLTVIAHPSNPLAAVNADQLRDLFEGRLTTWERLGVGSGAIQIIAREPGSDAAQAFATSASLVNPMTANARLAPSWAAMRDLVARDPNALGYLPTFELEASVKKVAVEGMVLQTLIIAIAPSEPMGAGREWLGWAQSH